MYVPRQFAEDRGDAVVALMRAAGFGHLVVATATGFESSPIPFVVDDRITSVRAHVARPNPLWKHAPCDALLIVPVTDAYISPTWYPSKAEHGKVVPTWNYEVVHVHGRLVAHDDAEWVGRQIRDLTDTNEADMEVPWSVDDPPADYIASTQRGIVGIEIDVVKLEAKRKLSQNRTAEDQLGVRHGLDDESPRSRSVGQAMAALDQ
jgi:transcriptional regulator